MALWFKNTLISAMVLMAAFGAIKFIIGAVRESSMSISMGIASMKEGCYIVDGNTGDIWVTTGTEIFYVGNLHDIRSKSQPPKVSDAR